MDTKERAAAANPEEELRRLREKSSRDELSELKRGLLGGYRGKDVAQYIARLKNQLQTAERTYRSRISELTQEKEKLRGERDGLQEQLKRRDEAAQGSGFALELQKARREAEGILSDKGSLEEQLKRVMSTSGETIADLQEKVASLESELEDMREARGMLQAEMEALQVRIEARSRDADGAEAELRSQMEDMKTRAEAECARADGLAARAEGISLRAEQAERLSADLAAQLEVARQNITELVAEDEEARAVNAQLRKALNSLVVKADAIVKENGVLSGLLDAEREKLRQQQSEHSRLSDLLARVRMADRLLEERIAELGAALPSADDPPARISPGTAKRLRADPFDFSETKDPLKDIVAELNAIHANLAQYQLPARPDDEPDKKPNIRYSVEKLEVDCPAGKKEHSWEEIEEFEVRR